MPVPKVFFDANDGTMEHGYWLGFEQSQRDLEEMGGALRPGSRIVIYMPNELQMQATLRFDPAEDVWWGDPIPNTIEYLDGST
jgi:hypothetical protein